MTGPIGQWSLAIRTTSSSSGPSAPASSPTVASSTATTSAPRARRSSATDPADDACGHFFDVLDVYAELVAAGEDPEAQMPGMTVHLRACSPCAQDLEGLLLAVPVE